ncbi:MAG: PQQ-binding-like beta-propeller repeat protein [Ilumatobacteraceae bacterium]
MRRRSFRLRQVGVTAVGVLVVPALGACGDSDGDTESAAPSVAVSPPLDEMCGDGQVPQAVAYDLDDGSFRWASCAEGNAYRSVRAVTDDAVYVQSSTGASGGETLALDPANGRVLIDAPALPPVQSSGPSIEVDGFTVTGGQDDPTTVSDADGNELWSQPGVWVYDDVWAIDDGAVFAFERESSRLVAYELESGEIRWEYAGDPYAEGLWPWHAEDGRVYTMWNNVQVRDAGTGDLRWATAYPPPPNPDWRLSGVDADSEAVYVGVGTAASSGD